MRNTIYQHPINIITKTPQAKTRFARLNRQLKLLKLDSHTAAHLFGAVTQDFVQDFKRAVSGAVPGIDFLDIQFTQALGKGAHDFIFITEQVEATENRINLFAREGRLDFFYDIVCAAVAAAVHDK